MILSTSLFCSSNCTAVCCERFVNTFVLYNWEWTKDALSVKASESVFGNQMSVFFFSMFPPLLKMSVSFNQVASFQLKFLPYNVDGLFVLEWNVLSLIRQIITKCLVPSTTNYKVLYKYFIACGKTSLLMRWKEASIPAQNYFYLHY